jgi:CDP-diacylglycerol--glycerol-3-phosphate 3-phosphatidyltransferase
MLTSLPNLLTLSRIGLIPVLLLLLYLNEPWARWTALVLFTLAGVTDWLDGYLARNRGQVSSIGRFLDPIADKLLISAVILLLVAVDSITGLVLLPALVILCREILVSGLREYHCRRQRTRFPAGPDDRRGRPVAGRRAHPGHGLRLPVARPEAHAGALSATLIRLVCGVSNG